VNELFAAENSIMAHKNMDAAFWQSYSSPLQSNFALTDAITEEWT